ncbi:MULTISPECIES: transporter [unclassified Chelatococcus]|uniref:SphA family protein n=1 Tax=unclassified Chelatococcus TaxID=2638111 RepID=UPI001BCEF2E1|nr:MULTISPECIES: transporter [unclassified Chelatococcus]MBS7698372.1 transporter [Chelatococcus sp. YT9]MBX3558861.1 transporter [Chelatococcus sp.]
MSKQSHGFQARNLRRRHLAAVVGCCLAASALGPAEAAENGIGFYLLGSRGPMAGYVPPPGFYLQNDIYFYDGTIGGGRSFPSGGRVVANVKGQARADFVTATWVTPWQVLGGNIALGAIVPFGRVGATAGIELAGPRLGGSVGRTLRDRAEMFGDPVASAVLGWHSGKFHWNTTLLVNVPIGDYREGGLANLAFNRWAADLSGALTWLDPELGVDLSATAGFTFNGENPATDYRTGTEFHVEWAATKTLTKELSVGLVGYHYQQVSGDSGAGATLGGYEGRVTALGGTVAYNFEAGKTPISTRVKVFREFNVKNRQEGTVGFFTVSLPITAGN